MMKVHSAIEELILSYDEIVEVTKKLANQIKNDYDGKRPILVGMLKGCVMFFAELMKHLDMDLEIDFMDVSSYHGTTSTGKLIINKDLTRDITGRHILIVDDIVDTGITLQGVLELLKERGAISIEIVTLLDKPEGRKVEGIYPKYIGHTIPKKFVVGFGLDYDELYRNLPYIGVLKRSVYEK